MPPRHQVVVSAESAKAHVRCGSSWIESPPLVARAAILMLVLALAGCGKKGPPLAPMRRVPAQIAQLAGERSGETVFLSFGVPSANIGGDQPADVAQVEVYATTAEEAGPLVEGVVPEGWTLVASAAVRRPVPPPPPPAPGAPEPPPFPPEPGLEQGQRVTFAEVLTAAAREPAAAPAALEPPTAEPSDYPSLSLPPTLVADVTALRRHYVASAMNRRGQRGPWSPVRSVPLGATSGAAVLSPPTYDAAAITLTWAPAADAHVPPAPPEEGLLPSRPLGPVLPSTTYNVYAATAVEPAAGPLGTVVKPSPVNAAVLTTPTFSLPGPVFGQERCFVVRGVDTIGGTAVEGPASAPVCVIPIDTFAPPAPTALEAVGGAGVISLIWEASDVPDLAGYLVFRGEGDGEPTTQLTPEPIRASSFEDRTVTPGVRYVYVIVAVDSATPPNRSDASNRAEETARQ